MFRKALFTAVLGIGAITGLAITPNTADAAVRVIRTERRVVVEKRTVVIRHDHRAIRYIAPRPICAPAVIAPCG